MTQLILESDESFFLRYPQRQARIRRPRPGEDRRKFDQMGMFPEDWKRIIAWKVPRNIGAPYQSWAGTIIRIPFVQQVHESFDDTDRSLMPLIEELMQEAAKENNMQLRGRG